ncbi:hypothetical protein PNQ29_00610 [Halobacterium salinarum]|uniref:hypothetical protein n=1 Tax=Halobacterium salinarum TaxID=2242 RepID=UPI002555E953|nr:hypothetical protein [Halobacterium salinarum]MDL0118261.1 hypothetical protein [Halobacterium salinarum]
MSDIKNYYASASLTEQIKDSAGHLAEVDDRVLFFKDDVSMRFAQLQIENYPYWHPDMPVDIEESEIWKDLVRYNKSENVMEAIRQGKISELSAMSGLNDDGIEATGLENYEKLLSQPASIVYLYANMGAGKTFFGALGQDLFLDWVRRKHGNDTGSEEVLGSNLKYLDGTTYANDIAGLLEWLKGNDLPKLFLFDEASLYANSLSMSNTQKAYASLLPIIILIRHYGGRIIFIGHSGTDLGKQMREMATVVKKDSEKRATFYKGIDDSGDPYGKKFSLYAIPEMIEGAENEGLIPDTNDKGAWKWTEDDRGLIESELADFQRHLPEDADECNQENCNTSIGLNEHGYCPSHQRD